MNKSQSEERENEERENEERKHSGSGFLNGMIWGFALGAVAALLLAPRSGVELRGQMADSVNRAGRRAKDTYDRASDTVNEMASKAVDIAENLTDRAATLTAKLNNAISTKTSSIGS
jgi:gas vesicle protein